MKTQNRLIQTCIILTIASALYPLYLQTMTTGTVSMMSIVIAYLLPVVSAVYATRIYYSYLKWSLFGLNIFIFAIVFYLYAVI